MFKFRWVLCLAVVCCLVTAGCKSSRGQAAEQENAVGDHEGAGQAAQGPTEDSSRSGGELSREELLAKCMPSAVNIRILNYLHGGYFCGGGVVLHESGYVLAGAHVFLAAHGGIPLVFFDEEGDYVPARVVAIATRADTCVLKINTDRPLTPVELGRTDGLAYGDNVLAVGQPRGELSCFSFGRIRMPLMEDGERMEIMESQIDRGFSGGAVFDDGGEFIGLVNIINPEMDGRAAAVRIDHIRRELAKEFGDETRYAFPLGLTVGESATPAALAVEVGGPADQAGVKVGDVVTRIGQMRVDDTIHYYLAMLELRSANPVAFHVDRDGRPVTLKITPAARPMTQAVEDADIVPGLRLRVSHEPWGPVLDFDRVYPIETRTVPTISDQHMGDYTGPATMQFDGYIRVPEDGEYVFRVQALEGATVSVAGHEVAVFDPLTDDADGESVPINLQAGLHPIVVDYYYLTGPRILTVTYEGPSLRRQLIPAESLFVGSQK